MAIIIAGAGWETLAWRAIYPSALACGQAVREYGGGRSPEAIAKRLNADGIPGPRGAVWGPSTVHGHRLRGTGILNNELHIGRRFWNRLRYRKNPATGRRVSKLTPRSEWTVAAVPQFRIVSDDEWQAAKARQAGPPLHPTAMAQVWSEQIRELRTALETGDADAREAVRELIGEIRLTPRDGELAIDVKGNLAAMLSAASPESDRPRQLALVAGAGSTNVRIVRFRARRAIVGRPRRPVSRGRNGVSATAGDGSHHLL